MKKFNVFFNLFCMNCTYRIGTYKCNGTPCVRCIISNGEERPPSISDISNAKHNEKDS